MNSNAAGTIDLGAGPTWEDLPVGTRIHSRRRTVTEADLVNFVNLTWLQEELFTVDGEVPGMVIKGRVVPGALVYSFAEGLVIPSMHAAGLAFFGAALDIKGPTFVGDTLRVVCEVTERRTTSKPGRGLVRTRNTVLNQRGDAVLVYDPLRLVRMREAPAA